MKYIILSLSLLLSFSVFGNTYETITGKEIKSEKPVVQMYFYYGCPHCLEMEKKIYNWIEKNNYQDKVKLEKIPFYFGSLSESAAKHYYTSIVLNTENRFSEKYYNEAVLKNKKISDELAISILDDYSEKKLVIDNLNSHYVKDKVNYAKEMTKKYNVKSVPTLIVNGKYKVNASITQDKEAVYESLKTMIDREL